MKERGLGAKGMGRGRGVRIAISFTENEKNPHIKEEFALWEKMGRLKVLTQNCFLQKSIFHRQITPKMRPLNIFLEKEN